MQFKISRTIIKSPDWKVVDVEGLDGTKASDVSCNRFDKEKKEFPNYDTIVDGATIEATLWQSQAGKSYLFAPKPTVLPRFKVNGGAITKNMEKKEASIEKFQTNKEESIKIASTFSAAWNSAIAEYEKKTNDLTSIEELFAKYREFYWHNFDVAETKYPPFK